MNIDNLLQFIGRQESFKFKRRKKLVWKLKKLFKISEKNFEQDFFGFKYKGNTHNHIDKYVYYFGAYERGMLHFIEETLKNSKEKVFLDIGANIGHHTLFASRFANQVFSFEPYEKVRVSIEEKVRSNNIQNVKILPFALGEQEEELTFFEPSDANTGTGSFVEGFMEANQNNGLKLLIRDGASVLEELNVKNISLIKIDTEGFEPSVLQGLLPVLKKFKPTIIMEFSSGSDKNFSDKIELKNFLRDEYEMSLLDNPNTIHFTLSFWDFDSYGEVVLRPKQT